MRNSFDIKVDPDSARKQAMIAEVVVGASALVATVLLLVQALPSLLHGVP